MCGMCGGGCGVRGRERSSWRELARFSTCERVVVQSPHPVSCTQTREASGERDVLSCVCVVWYAGVERIERESTIYASVSQL